MVKYSIIFLAILVVVVGINIYQAALADWQLPTDLFWNAPISRQDFQQPASSTELDTSPDSAPDDDDPDIDSSDENYRVAGLSCARHGGPDDATAAEMIYWEDIPTDADFVSPLQSPKTEQWLVFEPDEGGWNNIRMSMETAVMMALATGRTLVLPPEQGLYLLWNKHHDQHRTTFSLEHFYHFKSLQAEHTGLKVISLQEFLETVAMTGHLVSPTTGQPAFPPHNRTNWDNAGENYRSVRAGTYKDLWLWMRASTTEIPWNQGKCVAGFAAERGSAGLERLKTALHDVLMETEQKFREAQRPWFRRQQSYHGHPTPVDAPVKDRLAEMLANRREWCLYDEALQDAPVIHLKGEEASGHRLLVHFYAFLFFENWQHDLWAKRFVRDHLRYIDEIQCAAARVIAKLRAMARERGEPNGQYDAFHIRRGDFQYKDMHMSAEQIYFNNSKGIILDNRTVFIATDEKNSSYFAPLRAHYHCLFLHDFKEELGDVNPNYYGMIDQLIASRSETFFGAYYSTFTGYINRLRGYHSQKLKLDGYQDGSIKSYYYVPETHANFRIAMREYQPVAQGFWSREFPVAWRDIDHDAPSR